MENNNEIMILGTTSLPIDGDGKVVGRAAVIPDSPKHYLAKMLIGKPEFCDSLKMSGVKLSNREKDLISQLLPEDRLPVWNRCEREKLTKLFSKIHKQLKNKGFTAINELDEILLSILYH